MRVENTLQTNGVLLDDEWCEFLAENEFLVGLSIDGPRELHDAYRHDKAGNSVFDRVVAAARLHAGARRGVQRPVHGQRRQRRAPAGGLPFLPRRARRPLPAVHPHRRDRDAADADLPGTVTDRSVQPEAYGRFLSRSSTSGCAATWATCSSSSSTGCWRPTCAVTRACACCGRRAGGGRPRAQRRRATRATTSSTLRISSATSPRRPSVSWFDSEKQGRSGRRSRRPCRRTAAPALYVFACHGECPKNRILLTADGEPGSNWLCVGLKAFFAHTERPMRLMAEILARGARRARSWRASPTSARDRPQRSCPCGSGRKFKRCCGRSRAGSRASVDGRRLAGTVSVAEPALTAVDDRHPPLAAYAALLGTDHRVRLLVRGHEVRAARLRAAPDRAPALLARRRDPVRALASARRGASVSRARAGAARGARLRLAHGLLHVREPGIARTSASDAAILIGAIPIFVSVLNVFTLHERNSGAQWTGILLSFAGVVALIELGRSGAGGSTLLGNLLGAGAPRSRRPSTTSRRGGCW